MRQIIRSLRSLFSMQQLPHHPPHSSSELPWIGCISSATTASKSCRDGGFDQYTCGSMAKWDLERSPYALHVALKRTGLLNWPQSLPGSCCHFWPIRTLLAHLLTKLQKFGTIRTISDDWDDQTWNNGLLCWGLAKIDISTFSTKPQPPCAAVDE